jgi:glutamine amidotransferase
VPGRSVVVLDYGQDDVGAMVDALEAAGASVEVTFARSAAMDADGLVVSGSGELAGTMRALLSVRGPELIERRLAGGRAVLATGAGMHALFEYGHDGVTEALGEWPGNLSARSHEGWVRFGAESPLFEGVSDEEFYFEHDAVAAEWKLDVIPPFTKAKLTWVDRGDRFLAAVENGPLVATQFHPQKSGEAGIRLLRNWLNTL